jgi:hypothetical protein
MDFDLDLGSTSAALLLLEKNCDSDVREQAQFTIFKQSRLEDKNRKVCLKTPRQATGLYLYVHNGAYVLCTLLCNGVGH